MLSAQITCVGAIVIVKCQGPVFVEVCGVVASLLLFVFSHQLIIGHLLEQRVDVDVTILVCAFDVRLFCSSLSFPV